MFDLEDYVMAPDDAPEPQPQLLVGLTHSVLVPNDPTEYGRVFVDGGGANKTEHWVLRPTFRSPVANGPGMLVKVRSSSETLNDLLTWGRLVPGTLYVRAACTETVL